MPISEQNIKNEQMRMYDNGRLFAQSDLQNNMLGSQEMMSSYPPVSYEHTTQPEGQMTTVYGGKNSRLQYVTAQKVISQPDTYTKYNAGLFS